MKKNNSMTKKLVSASAMLAVSAAMLAASTYAWFTMNKEVEVTGMQLRTTVGANLLICSDNEEANYSEKDLVQGRMGLLEPVSSINATTGSFYYTVNATARGTKESGATITNYNEAQSVANSVAGKAKYDAEFNKIYGIKTSGSFTTSDIGMVESPSGADGAAYGYIDYVFYLKGTADSDGQYLNMTECNLLYNDAAISDSGTEGVDLDRAWRVAVFAQSINGNGGKGLTDVQSIDPARSADNLKGIIGLTGATYFTSGSAQDGATLGAVSSFNQKVTLDTFTHKADTNYYKVLVRIWLEGEDNTCNSETYAKLQNNWKLNCKFELQNNDDKAVTVIGSDTAKVASGATQNAVNTYDVSGS